MKKFNLSVEGMKCGGCASKIEKAVKANASVENCTVDLGAKTVQIAGADDLSGMNLKKAIEEVGFVVSAINKE